jgi:hypothetical protein
MMPIRKKLAQGGGIMNQLNEIGKLKGKSLLLCIKIR